MTKKRTLEDVANDIQQALEGYKHYVWQQKNEKRYRKNSDELGKLRKVIMEYKRILLSLTKEALVLLEDG